jgi:hypothetical protein
MNACEYFIRAPRFINNFFLIDLDIPYYVECLYLIFISSWSQELIFVCRPGSPYYAHIYAAYVLIYFYLLGPLDRETTATYNLNITATDSGDSPLTGKVKTNKEVKVNPLPIGYFWNEVKVRFWEWNFYQNAITLGVLLRPQRTPAH